MFHRALEEPRLAAPRWATDVERARAPAGQVDDKFVRAAA
jgi:hypothetical protein